MMKVHEPTLYSVDRIKEIMGDDFPIVAKNKQFDIEWIKRFRWHTSIVSPLWVAIMAHQTARTTECADAFRRGAEAMREACLDVCENSGTFHDIEWWLTATKKEVSAQTAEDLSNAVRSIPTPTEGGGNK